MDSARRERLRCLIELTGWVEEQVRVLLSAEEAAFEGVPPAFHDAEPGKSLKDAVFHVEEALGDIQTAIEHMQTAVGDAEDIDTAPPSTAGFVRRI